MSAGPEGPWRVLPGPRPLALRLPSPRTRTGACACSPTPWGRGRALSPGRSALPGLGAAGGWAFCAPLSCVVYVALSAPGRPQAPGVGARGQPALWKEQLMAPRCWRGPEPQAQCTAASGRAPRGRGQHGHAQLGQASAAHWAGHGGPWESWRTPGRGPVLAPPCAPSPRGPEGG